MEVTRQNDTLYMCEEVARVALAYLDKGEEVQTLLMEQALEKSIEKALLAIDMTASTKYTDEEVEEMQRWNKDAGHENGLFTYEVPIEHSRRLIGAFVLAKEGKKPSDSEILGNLESEKVISWGHIGHDYMQFHSFDR